MPGQGNTRTPCWLLECVPLGEANLCQGKCGLLPGVQLGEQRGGCPSPHRSSVRAAAGQGSTRRTTHWGSAERGAPGPGKLSCVTPTLLRSLLCDP